MFILPKKIIKDMTQKFNRFLWNGKDGNMAKAKVAWGGCMFPKERGRFGLEMPWGLEPVVHAKAHLEFVCLLRINLDCLGLGLSAEGEKFLECENSSELLLELEEDLEFEKYC